MNKSGDQYELALDEMRKPDPDVELAHSFLVESHRQGNAQATYALSTWYLYGRHVSKDLREAVRLLNLAARQNVSDALFDLAVCYETGEGVTKNLRKAFTNYLKAAIRGDGQATFEVGRCLEFGIGFKRDRRLAAIWFERAKELGVYERKTE